MDETLKAMLDEASKVAGTFARKNRWADLRDMVQEAQAAVLEAYKRYDNSRNPLAYAGMTATYALRAWVANNVSPVNVGWRLRHKVNKHTSAGSDGLETVESDTESADAVLMREQGLRLTTERVAALLAEGREAELAALVLLGQKSADVAEKAGVPVRMVYKARYSLAQKLKNDPMLREAWESL